MINANDFREDVDYVLDQNAMRLMKRTCELSIHGPLSHHAEQVANVMMKNGSLEALETNLMIMYLAGVRRGKQIADNGERV